MSDLTQDTLRAKQTAIAGGLEQLRAAQRQMLADLQELERRIGHNEGALLLLGELLPAGDGAAPAPAPDGGLE
jgi:hypothetical protein